MKTISVKNKGVYISRLLLFIKKSYRIYEGLMIMYVPFISSIMYCISVISFYNGSYNRLFASYNANLSGHSIFWLQLVLSRSNNMCKWYKLSIIASMFTHIINILYYHKMLDISKYFSLSLAVAIISIISWLVFRITYNARKVIQKECIREEERKRY